MSRLPLLPAVRALLVGLAALFAGAVMMAQAAQALETRAKQAILMDYHTGAVLFEKNADELMPPASMSKLMTVYMLFERIKDGRIALDDTMPVSEKAWRKQGSKMFVLVDTRVKVEDLIRGIIVQSGNDACIVVAEAIGGTEDAFAEMMTERAREIGLQHSTFRNATGWPHPEHRMTARDLALLARHLIHDFPSLYKYFSETEFTYSDITQHNRNPLLYKNMGADGLKTGHTEASGYGLVASAERDGRRLILVLNGLPDDKARAEDGERLLEWGFREFDTYTLFAAGDAVTEAPVWLGEAAEVPLVVTEDVTVTIPKAAREEMKVTAVFDSPVPAPIREGQPLATLRIEVPDRAPIERPLLAGRDVEQRGFFGRITGAVAHMVWGRLTGAEAR